MSHPNTERGHPIALVLPLAAGFALALSACRAAPEGETAEAVVTPTVTPAPFVPTITPIPPPTRLPTVVPLTATPTPSPTATPTLDPNVGRMSMEPNLGDVGAQVHIIASGFVPGSTVALHWTQPGVPPTGAPVTMAQVDGEGTFELTLTVPAVWPSGAPAEHDFLELRALGVENRQAWATYGYVPPPPAYVAPGGTYTNAAYGYSIDLPAGWTVQDADPADVALGPEGEPQTGFVRVVPDPDANAVIGAVMAEVAPGAGYSVEDDRLGAESGKRVVVSGSGQLYWFVVHGGRTYALHIPAPDEATSWFTLSTFRFTD